MGKIGPFIQRAKSAGLRSEVPEDSVFLVHGDGVCLIMSESLLDERDDGFVMIALSFGEPATPFEHPPRLALRFLPGLGRWELRIESEDDLPEDMDEYCRKFFCHGARMMDVANDDLLSGIVDEFIGRVQPVEQLACAS